MEIAVRYYSRGGSTEKVARAIAKAVGVKAYPVSEPLKKPVSVLFVGSGVYAGHIDKHVIDFLLTLDAVQVHRIVLFTTSYFSGKIVDKKTRKFLFAHDLVMDSRIFHCPGKFLFFQTSRPNLIDLDNAAKFARKVIKK